MVGSDRSGADSALLAALASGQSTASAASQAGVSERTIYRRLNDPDFRVQLDQVRAQMVERAAALLATASARAAVTLSRLLDADSDPVRLAAARAILEMSFRERAHAGERVLSERITELEAALDGPTWRSARSIEQRKNGHADCLPD